MDITHIGKRSLRTLWARKHLWFFGFFIAAAGGATADGAGSSAHGPLPQWLLPLLIAFSVLGLAVLIMNVLSEAALIRGVQRDQDGESLSIAEGFRVGGRHFLTVFVLKVLLAAGFAGAGVVVAAPIALGAFEVVPMVPAILVALPLVVVGIPGALTLYFLYEYALRFAVLEGFGARDAIRAARRLLHGRLGDSVRLTLLSFAGQLGGGLVTSVGALPGAALGLGAYFAFGLAPSVMVGALLVVPVVILVQGATGTFRSSVWTLGFLGARG
ncbi:MAG: hypothetical protein DRJ42_00180 [Deltaproteobacteria bacterium]|nr:MAG: hypothetical protein DRJ42_00180 [Deltaproteobacteria bacterium]